MFLSVLLLTLLNLISAKFEPECWMSPSEMAAKNGFNLKSHYVTTSDGYILQLHHIPSRDPSAEVVFLQHGLMDSSMTWILNGRNGSLGFILADSGYDVWMGNVRGNTYSRNHTVLSPTSAEFWDFSFDEMAAVDLPALVKYVTETTKKRIFYIGHSQGTEMGFIEFSRNEDLSKKIKQFIAFAPVARVSHIRGLILRAAQMQGILYKTAQKLGIHELFPSWWLTKLLATQVCPHTSLCTNIMFAITGTDRANFNSSRAEVYECHNPAGTSVKNALHWAQLIVGQELKMFDYKSVDANKKHYGQETPPVYNITGLRVPTLLVMGGEDWLADPQDEIWLFSKIGHAVSKAIIIDYYNHVDFIWGLDAPNKIYYPVIDCLKSYSSLY